MKLEVYKITNIINGKVYIGITIQGVNTRWYKHCSDANVGPTFPIHNAIRKYGKDNFIIETIEDIVDSDFDLLKQREIYWIDFYKSHNRNIGYNVTLGGDGTCGRLHSEETKEKIRRKAIGRKVTDAAKAKMSESHKKREYNKEELSLRAIKANAIRWSDPDQLRKIKEENKLNKTIVQYDKNGKYLTEYFSASEAARMTVGIKGRKNICSCATGKLKTAYGFVWKYKE